jgi:hypothetical protein
VGYAGSSSSDGPLCDLQRWNVSTITASSSVASADGRLGRARAAAGSQPDGA